MFYYSHSFGIATYASRNIPYAYCEQIGKEIRDISDEIPFEIPDSWEWVRLGMIGETNIGLTYRPADKTISGGTLVLRSSNIQNDRMDYSDTVYVSCEIPERAMIHKGDILICARNGSRALVGKCAIVDKDGMAFGAFMAKYSSPFNQYTTFQVFTPISKKFMNKLQADGADFSAPSFFCIFTFVCNREVYSSSSFLRDALRISQ